MENLRKRSEKDKIDSIKYGSINLARDILSLSDNLSRALGAVPKNENRSKSINNLIDGLKIVKKEFITILGKHGVERIESMIIDLEISENNTADIKIVFGSSQRFF